MPRTYSDQELDAAIEALTERERFREAESVVTAAAPKLQRVLAEALETGGWFGEAHEGEIRKAARRARRGGEADRAPHPARRGGADGDDGRRRRRLGAGRGAASTGRIERGGLNQMDIRFLGHACFELSEGDARVFVDPFL